MKYCSILARSLGKVAIADLQSRIDKDIVIIGQPLIIPVIRTNRISFLQSWASGPLTITTLSIMAFGMWLPYSPLASSLGLTSLPRMYWPILMLTLLGYVSLTQSDQSLVAAKEMDLTAYPAAR